MGSRQPRQYYCRCGTHLAKDNTERQCARCQRASRDKLITPPEVPAEFWDTEQFKEAFATQRIGRVFRIYGTTRITMRCMGQMASRKPCSASGWACGNPRSAGLRPGGRLAQQGPYPQPCPAAAAACPASAGTRVPERAKECVQG
jgi:hypothetical protein